MKNTYKKTKLAAAVIFAASLLQVSAAHAGINYLGMGSISNTATDLSGLTDTLENNVADNLLGGMGSGLAWSGQGNRFLALPDRGPNAVTYNTAVDNTASYIDRFHELDISVTQNNLGNWVVTPTLAKTTLLSSATALTGAATANNPNKTYFTGLSSGFDASKSSSNPNNMRLDPESIRVSGSGNSVFISDETALRSMNLTAPPASAFAR